MFHFLAHIHSGHSFTFRKSSPEMKVPVMVIQMTITIGLNINEKLT